MIETLKAWTFAIFSGGWGLFGLAFIESSVFPIPPDFLLIGLCINDPSSALIFALIATVGSTLGGAMGYGIGRWGGRPVLTRLFAEEKILKVQKLFDRHKVATIAVAGFTPIPYKLITIAAGVFHIDFYIFIVISFIFRGARFFLVGIILKFYGDAAREFFLEDPRFKWLTLLLALVGVLAWLIWKRFKSTSGQKKTPAEM